MHIYFLYGCLKFIVPTIRRGFLYTFENHLHDAITFFRFCILYLLVIIGTNTYTCTKQFNDLCEINNFLKIFKISNSNCFTFFIMTRS